MGFSESFLDEFYNPRPVVFCCIFGEKSLSRRGDIGVTDVGEDLRGASIFGMQHNAHAEFVGGTFETDGDHIELRIRIWSAQCGSYSNSIKLDK